MGVGDGVGDGAGDGDGDGVGMGEGKGVDVGEWARARPGRHTGGFSSLCTCILAIYHTVSLELSIS